MRRAIIADIAANLIALEAVLADCRKQAVDEIVCLGGIVGYGPEPAQCLDRIREACAWVLIGRPELAVLDCDGLKEFGGYFRTVFEWHRSLLMPRSSDDSVARMRWDWLKKQQNMRVENTDTYAYATPRNPIDEPVTPGDFIRFEGEYPMVALDNFALIESLFFGANTHRPFVCVFGQDSIKPSQLNNMTYFHDHSSKAFINVGSVGQPRDCNPDSCYVIYDSNQNTIQFRRVFYDIPAAITRFKQHPEINKQFWMRLEKGL